MTNSSATTIPTVTIDLTRFPMPCPTVRIISPPGHIGPPYQESSTSFTAQDSQCQTQMNSQVGCQTSFCDLPNNSSREPTLSLINPTPLQQRRPRTNICIPEKAYPNLSDPKPQSTGLKSPSDGYNWRKYGQKQKPNGCCRSYYKCTYANCLAKRNVISIDGHVTEMTYKGRHNHDPPQKIQHSKENDSPSNVISSGSETVDLMGRKSIVTEPSLYQDVTSELKSSDDQKRLADLGVNEYSENEPEEKCEDEPDPKRRIKDEPTVHFDNSLITVKEPKIVIQTAGDGGHKDDGYRWHKYGQKIVRGNPNPRSYYKCTNMGCPVRKHVQRSSDNPGTFVVTYEGNHNHELPTSKKIYKNPSTTSPLSSPTSANNKTKQLKQNQVSEDLIEVARRNATDESQKNVETSQSLLSNKLESISCELNEGPKAAVLQQSLFSDNHAAVSV